jgi:CheY-like chemotaxis protein
MPAQTSKKPLILVVEDYPDSRRMLKFALETLDYGVLTAATGNEALSLAINNSIDLIVTDVGLPDIDGIRVVRELRKINDRLSRVPVIVLTAFDRERCRQEALAAGCAEVLIKPLDFEKLQALIERLLSEGFGGQDIRH